MEPLLFLVHRIPYPPNKGDKIRSFNMLRHLAARYEVHLGTLVDDPADVEHVPRLGEMCASLKVCRLQPRLKRLRSLLALGTGRPFGLRYFRERELEQWVQQTVARHGIRRVLVFSSTMAQYVLPRRLARATLVCDMVDLDSLKWTQYAERARGPMRALYRREGRCLAAWEREVIEQFDGTSFVSEQEADLFAGVHPGLRSKVFVFGNGVDLDYFDPAIVQPNPYPDGVAAVAFTGAMDYWPNIDAVSWYAHEIHPLVRAGRPEARFYIVGSNPTDAVRRLGQMPGVTVTGRVEDVRPYLQHAKCVVAPLRIARGVQNKVLEALAMARPIVATPDSLVGIASGAEVGVSVAAEAAPFARAVIATLEAGGHEDPRASPRDFVRARYSWPASLKKLDALLEQAKAP